MMQFADLPAGRPDPPPLPHQGGAAKQVGLQRQMVEAPAVGGRVHAHQRRRFGKQRQLARWPDRGLRGAFGHDIPKSVTHITRPGQENRPDRGTGRPVSGLACYTIAHSVTDHGSGTV